jgi:hypothetical protein
MIETIAGISIPDTAIVADATALVREATDDLLFHHSRRVFLFGALQGKRLGLEPDLELLYVGAMFHDLGLTGHYGTDNLRFEVDGANAARAFLLEHGISAADAYNVWTAIALHTTPAIPEFMTPEVALVTAGVETDVLGFDLDEIKPDDIDAVTAAHERPNFKQNILQAFTDGMKDRPDTTFGTMNDDVLAHYVPGFTRQDFVEIILGSQWPE